HDTGFQPDHRTDEAADIPADHDTGPAKSVESGPDDASRKADDADTMADEPTHPVHEDWQDQAAHAEAPEQGAAHDSDTGPKADDDMDRDADRGADPDTAPALLETSGAAETTAPADETDLSAGEADLADAGHAVTEDLAPASPPEDSAAAGHGFRFDANSKPVRFVWKISRDGKFSDVSPEFAAAVGPHSADIVGRSFPDLARVFNLDPDHVIADLLNRRDTWSGKTVYWPIQGTSLVTPVDLAALPTYTRDRQFDGLRGFGIVRMGETREDPEALGLALVPGARLRTMDQSSRDEARAGADDSEAGFSGGSGSTMLSAEDEADLEMRSLERDIEELSLMDRSDEPGDEDYDTVDDDGSDETGEAYADAEDPFRGERPAIRLVETPMRRDSDKIIDLEARRARPRDGLSPGEQAAFKEIGARLTTEASHLGTETADAESAAPVQQSERPAFGKRQSPAPGDIEIDFTAGPSSEPAGPDAARADADSAADDEARNTADAAASAEAPIDNHAEDLPDDAAESASGTPPEDADWIEAPLSEPMPSAFALPARQVMLTGLDAGLVDAIPAALLVHAGDELIHANAEFLDLTGYGSLAELGADGGLDHLLDRSDERDMGDGGMIIRRADGGTLKVNARLRSVNWGDGQALLLALSPAEAVSPGPNMSAITPAEAEALAETAEPEAPSPRAGELNAAVDQAAALKIETQELRSILETATDGVVILDNDGTIRSMNGSACALFNYDEGETQGQPFAMLFAHESQRAVMDYVSGLADHGVSSVLNDGREVIGREASGGFLPLFMTIGRLSGSNGFCAVLRDITQWKRTEEELRTAKRAAETANSHKSEFLARVSHEIRTPLNAIIGFSEMMVEERFGPIGSPRYLEYAHDIGSSGKHVLDIVNDLLDISKIEAGQEQMEFVAVSLNEHLAESVSLLQPMANSQRVIIRTSLSASVPEVVADRRSIKQIALNLLSNAIRFTPSGGQIVVSTSYEPSGNVIIRIRDTGIGMNRKELEQAMKPFGQVGPGPRQRGDGTGLGLPLTKAMVEANRAQFDIVSTPSEGTLVSISFPPQRVRAD
ncbi:MAG: PAS domain S-box protein, partial [Hoeflea sp.]|nr:PAS domain S-box protein [Hoeflea sp.]